MMSEKRDISPHISFLKLEQRLVLLAWLNGHFGYENNRDLLADMKEAAEGFDASDRSYVYHRLEARGDKVKIPLADLVRYDDKIREHLRAMNARRPEPITLRYFQHVAVLCTEIFLDWYFHRRGEMLRSLNRFVEKCNAAKLTGEPKDAKFSESDLKKLAFWMATGSGKTLIMHINYRRLPEDTNCAHSLRLLAPQWFHLRCLCRILFYRNSSATFRIASAMSAISSSV